jgi:hypothetical protein
MKKTLLSILAVSGLLALFPATSNAHGFDFEVSVGPGYYEGGSCGPRYGEYRPYYYDRPTYYYRRYSYRPTYVWPDYQGYYPRRHHCRHWEDED